MMLLTPEQIAQFPNDLARKAAAECFDPRDPVQPDFIGDSTEAVKDAGSLVMSALVYREVGAPNGSTMAIMSFGENDQDRLATEFASSYWQDAYESINPVRLRDRFELGDNPVFMHQLLLGLMDQNDITGIGAHMLFYSADSDTYSFGYGTNRRLANEIGMYVRAGARLFDEHLGDIFESLLTDDKREYLRQARTNDPAVADEFSALAKWFFSPQPAFMADTLGVPKEVAALFAEQAVFGDVE